MSDPFVTVVVPAYNAELYITEALDSVVAQTFSDYEVVIVDDGSTDATARLVEPYLADPRFSLIGQNNAGLAGARNTGVSASKGTWIALLDADDAWMPQKLERQVELAKCDTPPALIFSNGIEFDEIGDLCPFYRDPDKFPEGEIIRRLMRGNCLWAPSVMIRRQDVIDVGMFRKGVAEDFDLWLRILERGGEVRGVWEPLTRYRKRSDSLSANKRVMYERLMQIYSDAISRTTRRDHRAILSESLQRTKSDLQFVRARELLATDTATAWQIRRQILAGWWAFPRRVKVMRLLAYSLMGQDAKLTKALARKW